MASCVRGGSPVNRGSFATVLRRGGYPGYDINRDRQAVELDTCKDSGALQSAMCCTSRIISSATAA